VNIGDQFTVYTAYHYGTHAVLWSYDWSVVEPVSYIGSASTSVTFRAIAASPSAGSIIQAVSYYYKDGTTSSGMNKDVDDWKVYVKDNSTVSLNSSYTEMAPGDYLTLRATPSNSSYSGGYSWSSSYSSVAYISGSGSSVTLYAQNPGKTTITVKLDNGNSAQCSVTVKRIDVSSASVYPSTAYIDIDETKTLSVSVYPNDAMVSSTSWYSSDATIASVGYSSGVITGKSEGIADIYCIVNGSVTSSSCRVKVSKPDFTLSSSSPLNNETGQSVFVKPSMTFCRQIYQGTTYSDVILKSSNGNYVSGSLSLNSSTITFSPSSPLDPNTTYVFSVPAKAVKDKYDSYNSSYSRTFTTGNREKLTLKASITERFVVKGTKVTLTSSQSGVAIYYTLDGTTPTTSSMRYQSAITINKDTQLRAVAMGTGYENSDVLSIDYIISNVEMVRRFPLNEAPMYLYDDVNPFVAFSNRMEAGDNIGNVTLMKNGLAVEIEAIVTDSVLYLVPVEPLVLGCSYTVNIPADAAKTWQGESCKATSWTFSTGDYATAISTGGPELSAAIKTDGSLWTWGKQITSANAADGSYSYTMQEEPSKFVTSDVVAVSSGYMHHAIIKRDGSLWMWGRQYCGEFGNNSTSASPQPVKVMDGVKRVSCGLQNTAIVKQDGTLWMCGRNDYGQIDESRTVRREFVELAKNIEDIKLNWGSLLITRTDGTVDVRTWDERIDSQRKPSNSVHMQEYDEAEYGWKNSIALGKDGSVWTWNDTLATPTKIIEGRISSTLAGLSTVNSTVTITVEGKGVLTALPVPLTADYTAMTWSSGNNGVVTVDGRGVVTGIKDGSTTVTAEITTSSNKHFYQKFTIRVNKSLILPGDVNDDGAVDIADAVCIVNHIVGKATPTFIEQAADVNVDGVVDIADAVRIVNLIVGKIDVLTRKPDIDDTLPEPE
jgi:uncharacterized protein YjdB